MNSGTEGLLKLDVNQKNFIKRIIFLFPLMLLGCFIFIKISTNNTGIYWTIFANEDTPVEWATSLVYFLSFLVALSIGIDFYKQKSITYGVIFLVLALGFFLISMEEISWGQRIFQIESPEFFQKHNAQQEITLHNMGGRRPLHAAYILVGFYGAFALKLLPKSIKENYKKYVKFLIPSPLLFFYFLPTLLFYLYVDYLVVIIYKLFGYDTIFTEGRWIMPKDQEFIELILGFGFLCFVLINKYRQKKMRMMADK